MALVVEPSRLRVLAGWVYKMCDSLNPLENCLALTGSRYRLKLGDTQPKISPLYILNGFSVESWKISCTLGDDVISTNVHEYSYFKILPKQVNASGWVFNPDQCLQIRAYKNLFIAELNSILVEEFTFKLWRHRFNRSLYCDLVIGKAFATSNFLNIKWWIFWIYDAEPKKNIKLASRKVNKTKWQGFALHIYILGRCGLDIYIY